MSFSKDLPVITCNLIIDTCVDIVFSNMSFNQRNTFFL